MTTSERILWWAWQSFRREWSPERARIVAGYLWFRDHGEPPRTAIAYARAEREAHDLGWHFTWDDDQDAEDESEMCCADGSCGDTPQEQARIRQEWASREHKCEVLLLHDQDGELLDSLHRIWDADPEYRRVCEADMARSTLPETT